MTKVFLILVSLPLVLAGPVGWIILPFLWLPTMLGDAVKKGVYASSQTNCPACRESINKGSTKCRFCQSTL